MTQTSTFNVFSGPPGYEGLPGRDGEPGFMGPKGFAGEMGLPGRKNLFIFIYYFFNYLSTV